MAERKARSERAAPRRRAEVIETTEGFVGDAQRVDTEAVLARAEAPNMLTPQALDERQAAIGERRRRGGPPLQRRTRRAADESPPNVPPTNAMEPPA